MATLKFVNSLPRSSGWLAVGMGELPRDLRTGAQLRITTARPGTVHFELDVQKEHTNRLGILHGGTIASMVTYLGSGGKVGDKILAEVTCDKFGNKLAYTTIKFTNKADEIVARGSHTKYIAQAFRDPRNIIEQKKS
ncbi:hypothetical protein TESG_07146 [Trichophyton tonsurans CBS 112818]|uniref:Thioesterase domain-containing protein n=1 Tax=Trichophyton tonsurans (strain CBS 112818) TaxID=647933 RepID=F2S8B0_TRIT1|nr:hypothetical protein TESG_07146 [Trichophyton tonsurans CBS 112818]